MEDVVIVGAARTPIGSFNGRLAAVPATRLGSVAAAEALRRAGVDPEQVDETIFGNVLSAGLGQAPARQVAIGAKVPATAGALTVNKVCGSGLMAVMLAANRIQAGEAELVLAGGMESMSRAPYLLDRARTGYRMGHAPAPRLHDPGWAVGCVPPVLHGHVRGAVRGEVSTSRARRRTSTPPGATRVPWPPRRKAGSRQELVRWTSRAGRVRSRSWTRTRSRSAATW